MRPSPTELAVALAGVFAVSFVGYAQLGGPEGVLVPYTGRLDLAGTPATGPFDFTFHVYDAPTGGSPCWSGAMAGVPVSGGAFSVVLGPIDEGCVAGRTAHLEIEVQGPDDAAPVPLLGRQRLHGALSAHTSAPGGDFYVAANLEAGGAAAVEELWVRGNPDTSVGDTSAPLLVGEPGGTHIAVDGNEVLARDGTAPGTLHLQQASGDTIIGAGGGNVGIGTSSPDDKLHVDGTARISRDLSVGGTVTWSCPSGTWRVGTSCVSGNRGSANNVQDALEDCHNQGMRLCPADVIALCDVLNHPSQNSGCGQVTDSDNYVFRNVLTSTLITDNGAERVFNNFGCYWSRYPTNNEENLIAQCTGADSYFCCSPVSAR